ncbi:MAG: hypothetical protein V5B36_15355 [Candidatus Accumulibacter sp. UW25]
MDSLGGSGSRGYGKVALTGLTLDGQPIQADFDALQPFARRLNDATRLHRATLALHTPLGTPLAGDTLFGQLCWALREAAGERRTWPPPRRLHQGQPWLVVSDGLPAGHLPRPTLAAALRRVQRRPGAAQGCPEEALATRSDRTGTLLADASGSAVDDRAYGGKAPQHAVQTHNTLNRLSGTTGEGVFRTLQRGADLPRRRTAHRPLPGARQRARGADEVADLLAAVGSTGFGRDARVGLGKFTVDGLEPCPFAAARRRQRLVVARSVCAAGSGLRWAKLLAGAHPLRPPRQRAGAQPASRSRRRCCWPPPAPS